MFASPVAVELKSQFCELGKKAEEESWGSQEARVEGDPCMFGFGKIGKPCW